MVATIRVEEESIELAPGVGLPEVDRIIDGCEFKAFRSHSRLISPEKGSICKFRELAARAARATIIPPLPKSSDDVDHISRLPDDILKFIISLLTMREAAATTILSPRWRDLWTTSLSCLNFDVPNMLGHHYPRAIFKNKTIDYISRKRSFFTNWVNHVTAQLFCHASLRLQAFRVSFILNADCTPDIDRWITSSVARGATHIHLDFNYDDFYGAVHDPYKIYVFRAQQVASTVRHLYLKYCEIHLPPDFTGFTSLVSLSLYKVYITPAFMENFILPQCPLLEVLTIDGCIHPDDASFEFTGTSLRLKHLYIRPTTAFVIASIKVHNINLLSFELLWYVQNLSIENAPHLTRLTLLMENPVDIISNTPRLETLLMVQYKEKTCSVPQHVLNNLKRLVFVSERPTNLLGVVSILEACHLLQKLELDMGIEESRVERQNNSNKTMKKITALPGFPLNNLKEIEIYGFEYYPEKVALVEYLVNNAVVLQKMKIHTTSKTYNGNGRWDLHCREEEKQAESLEKIHESHPNVPKCVALFSQA